jgi:lipid-binding SYLF domain-containing protein
MMIKTSHFLLACVVALMPLAATAWPGEKKSAEDERQELREARSDALKKLYAEIPKAKAELASAKGYAVFSNIGINVLVVSTQRGGGILHDNRDGRDVYMKMFSAGGGYGMGVKDFSAILVFDTDEAVNTFETSGWDFSAQADANLESDAQGSGAETAMTAMPDTRIYQLTDAGVALQATLQGTKFWVDEDLN